MKVRGYGWRPMRRDVLKSRYNHLATLMKPQYLSINNDKYAYLFSSEHYISEKLDGLDMTSMACRIRYYRVKKGIGEREMGRLLGMKNFRSYAKTYENREHPSGNVAMLQKICQVLEVDEKLVLDDYIAFMAGDYKRKLKGIREALGQSKAGMDKLLGQQKGVYGRWERGDVVIGRGSLEKVRRVASGRVFYRK